MKITILIILLFAFTLWADVEPCKDYTCDSLAVQAILDSNGMSESVDSVSSTNEKGRINTVYFFNKELLKVLPPEIGKIKYLERLTLRENKLRSLPPEIGMLVNLIDFRSYRAQWK